MFHLVDGFERRRSNGKVTGHFINGERVSEGRFRREYIRALEAELDAAHAKLAKIFEIL